MSTKNEYDENTKCCLHCTHLISCNEDDDGEYWDWFCVADSDKKYFDEDGDYTFYAYWDDKANCKGDVDKPIECSKFKQKDY